MYIIGSDETRRDVFARIDENWDVSGIWPKPTFNVVCPHCRADLVIMVGVVFNKMQSVEHGNPCRAEIKFKCPKCSYVWVHCVVIPQRMYEYHKGKAYHWRDFGGLDINENQS